MISPFPDTGPTWPNGRYFFGLGAERLDIADAMVGAGADEFLIGVDGPRYDMGPVKEWIAWRHGR